MYHQRCVKLILEYHEVNTVMQTLKALGIDFTKHYDNVMMKTVIECRYYKPVMFF